MNDCILSRLDHMLDKYLCTRQIVIYGHGNNFEVYNRHLEDKYSGLYAFSVDIDNKKVDGVTIKNVEELKNHVADYYVVVSVGVLDYSILNLLERFGYQQDKDFFMQHLLLLSICHARTFMRMNLEIAYLEMSVVQKSFFMEKMQRFVYRTDSSHID